MSDDTENSSPSTSTAQPTKVRITSSMFHVLFCFIFIKFQDIFFFFNVKKDAFIKYLM